MALHGGAFDASQAAREARDAAKGRKANYLQRVADTSGAAPDEGELAAMDAEIAQTEQTFALVTRSGGHILPPEAVADIKRPIVSFARKLNGSTRLVGVRVRKSGTIGGLVDKRSELLAERQAINEAPEPYDVAGERLVREIDKLAAEGAPVGALEGHIDSREPRPTNRRRATIRWPRGGPLSSEAPFLGVDPKAVPALVAWLAPEAIKRQVLASLKAAVRAPSSNIRFEVTHDTLKELNVEAATGFSHPPRWPLSDRSSPARL